jgi:Tfp pilus assembly protein PilZ
MFGVGIWVSSIEDTLPTTGETVVLDLTLPDHGEPMQIVAMVQYQQPAGDQTRVGLQVCTPDTKLRKAQEKTLTSYVMARQFETARLDNERRQALLAGYPSR